MVSKFCCVGVVAILAMMCGCAKAEPVTVPPPPFQVPLFDGMERSHKPPAGKLVEPVQPEARYLFELVNRCWPAPSWFRGELELRARAGQQQGNQATTTVDPNTGNAQTAGSGRDMYVGLVASLPLYSATDIDKERQREQQRRDATAQAVGALGQTLGEIEVTRRQIAVMRAVEKRSQERVATGIAPTDEQLAALQKLSDLELRIYTLRGTVTKSRLQLLAMCGENEADAIDAYVGNYIQGYGL